MTYELIKSSKQDIDRLLGEENRIYLLNDNGESYYFIKCDFKGEI